jgi:hypothetical protein
MNEELTEEPSTARKLTDIALLIVAFAAVASWVWRRLRKPAATDELSPSTESQALDDKVGSSVGFPPNNAPV